MKKIIFLFLVVVALFVVSCAPGADKEVLGDVTPDEAAQVVPSGEKGALAGQATKWENCVDSDTAGAWNEKSQLLTKSSTSYTGGSKEDQCYTWYKGTPKEKTRLIEGVCKKQRTTSKFNYWYVDCSALGSDFQCVDGACIEEKKKETHSIDLKSVTDKKYNLLWRDGDGMIVIMPLAYLDIENKVHLGLDGNKNLTLNEGSMIQKNNYFVLSKGGKSYLLQYKGADKLSVESPQIMFKNVGNGETYQTTISTGKINMGGQTFVFKSASDTSLDDFALNVDLNGDGHYNLGDKVMIYDHGYQIEVDQIDLNHIELHILGENIVFTTIIQSDAEKQILKAVFMDGCNLLISEPGKKSCSFPSQEQITWSESGSEEFIFSYIK